MKCKSCHTETTTRCAGCNKPVCPPPARWSCAAEASVALAEAHGCDVGAALCEYCQGLQTRLKNAAERPHKNMLRWRKGASVPVAQLAEMLNVIGDGWAAETFRKKVDGRSQTWHRFYAPTAETYFECGPRTSLFGREIDDEASEVERKKTGNRYVMIWKKTGPGWWLNDHGLVEAVCAELGMLTVEGEKEKKRLARRREENRQTCPVCFRDICINDADTEKGVMVNHGYERPGHGYIVGNCFGVHYQPYEVSCQGTRDFLAQVVVPEVDRRKETVQWLATKPSLIVKVTRRISGKWEEVQEKLTTADGYKYEHEHKSQTQKAKANLRAVLDDMAFLVEKVETWKKAV